jgi:1-acyl-sn-glycerol-3-phosphate acyltransferase
MIKLLLQKLNYAWRLFAMAWFFVGFAAGALLLGYVIMPFIQLFSRDRNQEAYKTQYAIHLMLRFMIFLLQKLGVASFKFKGFSELKKDQACLILANHPTLIDYVAIMAQLSYCNNIVKKPLWRNIFLKRVINKAAYIPNTQSFASLAIIKKTLKKGDNILMFPEGTRTVLNQPLVLKGGAAQIAVRTQAPIRLIHISCIPPILTKQQKWYKIPSIKPQFTLTVGERLEPEGFFKETQQPSVAVRQLTQYLQNKLERG